MTKEEAVKWLENLKSDMGKMQFRALWDYKQAIDEIINLLSANAEWTPVSKKLPSEKDGRVLVTKHDEVITAIYSEFSSTWYIGEMCAVGGENPIAWMFLPEPYREDSEDYDYELATEQMEYNIMYEPTYNPEDGSM